MTREVDDGVLILDTESAEIHQLNSTASFIWSRCDEVASAEEIAALLAKEFSIDEDVAARDVLEILSRLRALNLVVEA
jgi:PqqD family protein of HPr-rel-A system